VSPPAGGAGTEGEAAGSIWQASAATAEPMIAGLPRRCEVLVVGGGITGASLLLHLAARDVDVRLVERGRLACGASGRNAGFILTGLADNYAVAVRRMGRRVAGEAWSFSRANGEMLTAALQGRAGHSRRGSCTLATSSAEADELEESATLLGEDGFEVTFSRDLDGSLGGYHAALLTPGDAEVDPVATVRALASGHAERISEQLNVTAVEATGSAVRVDTSAGECIADTVILATNAGTSALLPDLDIVPMRGQMLATEAIPTHIAERPVYADRGYRYWRQLGDGRLILGGCRDRAVAEESTDRESISETIQGHLDAELQRLGVSAPVTHRWAGIMGFTPDHLPLVGAVSGHTGVFVCGGYSGHGMGFAVHATRVLCDHIVAGTSIPEWMSAQRVRQRASAG
jgi:gamma-glutamylputrescine oxidase